MKTISLSLIARVLLSVIFISGAFQHFTIDPIKAYQSDFITALYNTGYLWQLIGIVLLVCGIGILLNKFTALSLVVAAPVSVIIFCFHITELGKTVLKPGGIYIGSIIIALHLYLAWQYKDSYKALFIATPMHKNK